MKLENNIIIPVSDPIARARSIMKLANTCYRLKYPNGGVDPRSLHPAADYNSPELKRTIKTLDCSGWVAWVCGYSRLQNGKGKFPAFPDTPGISGGYINTNSMIEEALGFNRRQGLEPYVGGRWFSVLTHPVPGCIVVFHGRNDRYPKNPSVGHAGIVSAVPAEQYEDKDREQYFRYNTRNHKYGIQVIHCSSRDRVGGKAIAETDGHLWANRGSLFLKFNTDYLLGLKSV